jgi:predicted nucleotidyltransferase
MRDKILKDLKVYIKNLLDDNLSFSILYGGFAFRKDDNYKNDIDLLVVTKTTPSHNQILTLKDFIIDYSITHGLQVDEEVSFENKLVASEERIRKIFSLRAFHDLVTNTWKVREITDDDLEYLNSPKFLDRLFLNVFTSIHAFVGGDMKRYKLYKRIAFQTLFDLTLKLCKDKNSSLIDLTEILFPPEGVYYKDYLGYPPKEEYREYIHKNMKGYFDLKERGCYESLSAVVEEVFPECDLVGYR